MLKILFINPPNDPFTSKGILIEPIDTLHVASFIESIGYDVTFLDMDVKKLNLMDLKLFLQNQGKKFDVCVVIFDYHIPLHDSGTNAVIKSIFDIMENKQIISILGGKAATFYEEDKLINLKSDFYISYDLEEPLKNLLSSIENNQSISTIENIRYWNNDKLILNTINKNKINLNQYPIPNRKLLDLSDYIDVRTILSSRGCNLKCTFCHVPGFWGNWISRDAQNVVDEISYLTNSFNAKKILFLDDNAIAQPSRMLEISNLLIQNNNKTLLGCLGTIVGFNKIIFEKMYKSGFRWIHYGAESGDNHQLELMKKKTTADKIKSVIKETQDIGFRVRTSWILDMPGLTPEAIEKTERLILEQNSEEIRLHFLTLRLGSSLFNENLIDTPQFIHNNKPNLNISGVDSLLIKESLERILIGLKNKGYTLVINPDDFIDIEKLKINNEKLKIVSLCPLRYGLGWYE